MYTLITFPFQTISQFLPFVTKYLQMYKRHTYMDAHYSKNCLYGAPVEHNLFLEIVPCGLSHLHKSCGCAIIMEMPVPGPEVVNWLKPEQLKTLYLYTLT